MLAGYNVKRLVHLKKTDVNTFLHLRDGGIARKHGDAKTLLVDHGRNWILVVPSFFRRVQIIF